jgi:prepilin-type N-terminal cleavage/methylation domain-containing protein
VRACEEIRALRREAGFSLYELMIVVAVLGTVVGTIAGITHAVHRADRVSAAYVEDLAGLRRAVVSVERDLRAARSLADLQYVLDLDVLKRGEAVVARRIGTFEIVQDGEVVTARIGLLPRAEAATREAVVETSVRLGGRR